MSVIINHNHISTANLVVSYDALNSNSYSQAENLFTYSQTFDNVVWGKFSATVTANTIIAPDGTLTGYTLTEDAAAAQHLIAQSNPLTYAVGDIYTLSVYAKHVNPATNDRYLLLTSFGENYILFNVVTGAVIQSAGSLAVSNTSVGNGWWRFSATFSKSNVSSPNFYYGLWHPSLGNSYTGNNTSNISLWGAQLERGGEVTPYNVTVATNVTRSTTIPNIVTPGTYNGTANVAYWNAGGGTGTRAPAFFFNNNTTNVITAYTIPDSFWQGSWTAIMAVKMNQVSKGSGDNAMISHGAFAGNGGLHLGERSSRLYLGFFGNDISGTTPLVANRWYVFAWTYNSSALYRSMYIDGIIEAGGTTAAYIGTGTNTEIGRYTWLTGYVMFGHIGAVKLFSRALGASERSQESKAMQKQ